MAFPRGIPIPAQSVVTNTPQASSSSRDVCYLHSSALQQGDLTNNGSVRLHIRGYSGNLGHKKENRPVRISEEGQAVLALN
jgi:hypothetical protein